MFYDGHTNGNTSYVFAGDANGDSVSGNDLIYIPRDTSEMNFKPLTVSGRTYTAADQAAAFEQLHQERQLPELAPRPVRRAQRGVPADGQPHRPEHHARTCSTTSPARKHSGQIRLDITNFGNLLNNNWGVGQRLINNSDPDEPDGRCHRQADLQPADRSAAT